MREFGLSEKKIGKMWWLKQDLYVYWALDMLIRQNGGDPDNLPNNGHGGPGGKQLSDEELMKIANNRNHQEERRIAVEKLQKNTQEKLINDSSITTSS